MKVGNENGNEIFYILYGNNHFELTHLFDNDSNNMNISRNTIDNDRNFFCTIVCYGHK